MADTLWGGFTDRSYVEDSDIFLVQAAGGGGINVPGSALLKNDSVGTALVRTELGLGPRNLNGARYSRLGMDNNFNAYWTVNASHSGTAFEYVETAGYNGLGSILQNTPYALRWGTSSGGTNPITWQYLFEVDNAGTVRAGGDNTQALGHPSYRWSVVYAASGSISTSDERAKRDIDAIPDAWLDAWGAVEWVRFRFIDAVAEKGDAARWHTGLIAQRIAAAFTAAELDAGAIGLLCFDSWEAETRPIVEQVERSRQVSRQVMAPAGEVEGQPVFRLVEQQIDEAYFESVATGEVEVIRPAGDRWSLRYDECLAIEAAWNRRELARLRAMIEGQGE